MTVIAVQHLHKRDRDHVAVQDVSFSVEQGEIFGILGWMLWMVTLHPDWSQQRRRMALYCAGLLALLASSHSPDICIPGIC